MVRKRVLKLMFHIQSIGKLALLTFLVFTLTGCSSGESPTLIGKTSAEKAGQQQVTLTQEQVTLYQTGLGELIKSISPKDSAPDFISVKTLKFTNQPGQHICGYARYKDQQAKRLETPFYVELREEEGKPTLHRGQLGSDEAKLSKVKFVCRYHGLF